VHPRTEAAAQRITQSDPQHDAYEEHVVDRREFSNAALGPPVEINSREDFQNHVTDVLESSETRCFTAFSTGHTWRQADIYYHAPTNTAVIVPEDKQQFATAFRPENGEAWFSTTKLSEAQKIEPAIEVKQGGIFALHPDGLSQDADTGSDDVKIAAQSFSDANPDSGTSPEQVEKAAYFALAVDDPVRYPPFDDEMDAQLQERRAYEEIGNKLREGGGANTMSKEERQAFLTEDRMQSYLDQQKQRTM
jgi:hypothetical protein